MSTPHFLAGTFVKALGDTTQIITEISTGRLFLASLSSVARAGVDVIFLAGFPQNLRDISMASAKERIPVVAIAPVFGGQVIPEVGNLYLVAGTVRSQAQVVFFAKYGILSDAGIYGYVAASILIEAVDRTKSRDAFTLTNFIRSRTWETPLGPIAFDERGNLLEAPLTIWLLEGGRLANIGLPAGK